MDGVTRVGRVEGDKIVDLSGVSDASGSMRAVIAGLTQNRSALESFSGPTYDLQSVRLEAPIIDPQKFLAIGMNYKAHADEAAAAGVPIPTSQLWFNKQVSCIAGPNDTLDIPAASQRVDYEAELAFVIGKKCRHVAAADAFSVIAGYMVCNDVTARDWQFRSPTYTLGKSFDSHGPIGPWIVTADEIPDPQALEMCLTVNGEERQRASTADMIYGIAEQIEYLTTVMTLEPGDIIATGTPAGVGIKFNKFLQPGDVVRVSIDSIGVIENRFAAENCGHT